MHIIDCPDCCGTGMQWSGRVDQPAIVNCIECDGTGEIEVDEPDVEDDDTIGVC